jgi:hypothetical protein
MNGLADDLLRGAKSIARFLNQDPRATYHLLSRGLLPAGKEGAVWVASKARLREHYAYLTAGRTRTTISSKITESDFEDAVPIETAPLVRTPRLESIALKAPVSERQL